MKRSFLLGAVLLVCAPLAQALAAPPPVSQSAQEQAYEAKIRDILAHIHPQTGDIPIAQAHATLHLANSYYFLGPDDARRVLVDAWRNPPDVVNGVIGLVFPKGAQFTDPDVWGAVVTYEDSGYVSDEDARTADYADLMKQMQEGQEQSNEARKEQGYPALHLVGWAQQPTYDAARHTVIWAQNLSTEGASENGLNYDVRLLGRGGVLSLNMLSSMQHLPDVRAAAGQLAQSASFDAGFRYADFVPDVDKKAGYGIAGLVAAGAGVAAAKKLGFLAIVLGLGKKLLVLVVAGFALLARFGRKLLGRRDADAEEG